MINNKDIGMCELCDSDWRDDLDDVDSELDSIKNTGRCSRCIEEYGTDGYPDR